MGIAIGSPDKSSRAGTGGPNAVEPAEIDIDHPGARVMNYGMYLSAGGALTSMHRMDVVANNLANVQTVGFKPDEVYFRHREPERLEGMGQPVDPNYLLEQLGGGTHVAPTRTNMKQGELIQTGNPLDLAISGEGFFVLSSGKGEGAQHLRFTRDGRFTLNATGDLVLAANGMKVLDPNDQPIRLRPGARVRIDADGQVYQDDQPYRKIQVAAIPDLDSLRKNGENLFLLNSNAQASRQVAQVRLEQGFLESSAVDPIMALNQMISASKTVSANLKLIQFHDNLMDQAINRFGRVA